MEEKSEVKKFTKEEILSNYKEFFTTVGVSSDSTHKEVLEKYLNWLEKKLS